ncbi:MAG: molybdopterin cofactor-binding domain-containing protein [Candidatus Azotimanducaceae bacterium]|uniref:Xanthine dehydrogenase family protein molybdopterin-binding subunit n=1 Tax=OM182 bacterium TaxID=2510334 RepID=A0A520S466_9GAMM|nr:isoquinoline 1-oxidoreductase [Gammaproteobacteria bacterium]OUV68022.1 MAG: hypothetical protein CBC93_03355 [Gammaproteobacteria bacterium TMED133]RZO77243.1 MAG: xanthine dehydrogenase family protein molybdopterin-binding subunit [OM182 bacterium]
MNSQLVDEITREITNTQITRRGLLQLAGLAGGGLVLASAAPNLLANELGTLVGSGELNAFVRLSSDGTITIYSARPDMGQGVKTSLPMIVAEEMGAKWSDVVVLQSSVSKKYGAQWAGGSMSIASSFDQMREMGASAREMLIGAASEFLELPPSEFNVSNSEVIHSSGKKLSFGELAARAARQPVPKSGSLVFKDKDDYTIIGTSVSGVDNIEIVTGLALFGIDTEVPDMLYAAYYKCPAIGGDIVEANLEDIRKLPGIVDAFIIKGNGNERQLLSGVAVVGDSTWAVFDAEKKLKIIWDNSNASKDSWSGLVETAKKLEGGEGDNLVYNKGDVVQAFADKSNKIIEGSYSYSFVAHLCLEPMNCTASYRFGSGGEEDSIEIWAPTQSPSSIAPAIKEMYGIEQDRIIVNVTRMGGGFGRRFSSEFVFEAAEISRHMRCPIKLTWTREDDIQHDYFRAGGFQRLKGAIDSKGKLIAWDQHYIGMSRNAKPTSGSRFSRNEFPLPYLSNARGTSTLLEIGTPCGPWRAPGANTHAFVVQSFIHELAHLAGRDHLEFLLEMFGERPELSSRKMRSLNTRRAALVTRLAAEKAGWGRALKDGRGLGLAFHFSHAGHIAEVAEVSVDARKKLTVHKVTVAVDVGPIINVSGALAQVEGSVIDGLSALIGQRITMEDGQIEQSNLHDYPVLRISAAPEVDVHFIESNNPPTGLGEPALPPLAPAVGNAIFAATGQRVRNMPLTTEGYSA